jgi:hypothetical protein
VCWMRGYRPGPELKHVHKSGGRGTGKSGWKLGMVDVMNSRHCILVGHKQCLMLLREVSCCWNCARNVVQSNRLYEWYRASHTNSQRVPGKLLPLSSNPRHRVIAQNHSAESVSTIRWMFCPFSSRSEALYQVKRPSRHN